MIDIFWLTPWNLVWEHLIVAITFQPKRLVDSIWKPIKGSVHRYTTGVHSKTEKRKLQSFYAAKYCKEVVDHFALLKLHTILRSIAIWNSGHTLCTAHLKTPVKCSRRQLCCCCCILLLSFCVWAVMLLCLAVVGYRQCMLYCEGGLLRVPDTKCPQPTAQGI